MGKKTRFPFVSVCTPTFNRRPFIPMLIACYAHQTYPRDRMEFVIVDDGTDPVQDVVEAEAAAVAAAAGGAPLTIRYHRYEEHMSLSKKRNVMHSHCSGDILVYMDDDDFYPPERVAHAVEMLKAHPRFLIAGSSEMHSFFVRDGSMQQMGPYGKNRATAASFAFRRELLAQTSYSETDKWYAEEKEFLKNYTIPILQLDPHKTILVISHKQNTMDRETLYTDYAQETRIQPSRYTLSDFITDPVWQRFCRDELAPALDAYTLGNVEHKPDAVGHVTGRLEEWKAKREKQMQENAKFLDILASARGGAVGAGAGAATETHLKAIRDEYETKLDAKTHMINELLKRVRKLKEENDELRARVEACEK